MTLQTHEEEEILRTVRALNTKVDKLLEMMSVPDPPLSDAPSAAPMPEYRPPVDSAPDVVVDHASDEGNLTTA